MALEGRASGFKVIVTNDIGFVMSIMDFIILLACIVLYSADIPVEGPF